MLKTMTRGARTGQPGADRDDEWQAEVVKPWSRQDVQAWRKSNPPLSPWRVVAAQAVAGLLCSALVWAFTQRSGPAWSALYGALAVVVPGALLARGMTRNLGNDPGAAMAAMFRFMVWEMVKIGVAVAMLVAAPRVVEDLSWPALLVAMIVCIKMNWLALLWRRRPVVTDKTTQRV